jgi:hypothetical protein
MTSQFLAGLAKYSAIEEKQAHTLHDYPDSEDA